MTVFVRAPIKSVFDHYQRMREANLTNGIPKLESSFYRPKELADRARRAQIAREAKEDEWR